MNALETKVLTLLYKDKLTLSAIAKQLDLSLEEVRRTANRGMARYKFRGNYGQFKSAQ